MFRIKLSKKDRGARSARGDSKKILMEMVAKDRAGHQVLAGVGNGCQ
jgi:hypothetical protein